MAKFEELKIDKQVKLVNDALEDEVYTALAMHDGGLEIMDIKGLEVHISYQGACAGCPMASTGTLMFVENTLQEKVDKRIQVKIV
ncbi:NifU family protein [Patescibacteria group bacterium]|nr:NifU family protein [Patescibacteria group bacterium]MBU1683759.1 NifU family protein [Patescibacteria group bacterium]